MNKYPTTFLNYKVNIPVWLQELYTNISVDGKEYFGVRDFLNVNSIESEFNSWLTEIFKQETKVVRNWINFTISGTDNQFNWHDDLHRKGNALGILWLNGDVDCGGDFWYMDDDSMMHTFKFEPHNLITIPRHWIHKVDNYIGKVPRIALNFTYV